MGLFQGDGHGRLRGRSYEVVITAKEPEWAQAITDFCTDSLIPARKCKEKEYFRIRFYGPAAKRLTNTKTKGLWKTPKRLSRWLWLSGLIDTDGSVTTNRVRLWQKANGNLKEVESFLKSKKIPFTKHTYTRIKFEKEVIEECLDVSGRFATKLKLKLKHPDKNRRFQTLLDKCV